MLTAVVDILTSRAGRSRGKEMTVNRVPFPPAFAAIADKIVEAETMAKPPPITVDTKRRGFFTELPAKKIKTGQTTASIKKKKAALNMSFDMYMLSADILRRKKRAVCSSSSLVKM